MESRNLLHWTSIECKKIQMLIFVLRSVTLHWSALFEFPKQIVLRKERREPDQKAMIDIPDQFAHFAKCTPGHQQCVQQL